MSDVWLASFFHLVCFQSQSYLTVVEPSIHRWTFRFSLFSLLRLNISGEVQWTFLYKYWRLLLLLLFLVQGAGLEIWARALPRSHISFFLPSTPSPAMTSWSYLGCLWTLLFCSRGRLCPCNPPTSASWRTQILHLHHQALLKINSLFSVLWSVYLRIELTSDYSLIVEEFQTSITTVLFFFLLPSRNT